MNLRNGYVQYREQSILTASQGDLVLMLFDGCLRQLRIARLALTPADSAQPEVETASQALLKSQDIVGELMQGLDFHYDVAKHLFRVYEYVNYQLIQANIRKDGKLIENIEEIMTELRTTWEQVLKMNRIASAGIANASAAVG